MKRLQRPLAERGDRDKVRDWAVVWRSLTAADDEVEESFQRFRRVVRATRGGVRKSWSVWKELAYGSGAALAGLGALHLMSGVSRLPNVSPEDRSPPSSEVAVSLPAVRDESQAPVASAAPLSAAFVTKEYSAQIERAGVSTAIQPGVEYELHAGQQAVIVLGRERHSLEGPLLIELELAPERASGWRMSVRPPRIEQASANSAAGKKRDLQRPPPISAATGSVPAGRFGELSPAASEASEATHAHLWSAAAESIAKGDQQRAAAALSRLAEDAHPHTRDAAALALAQLRQSRGDPRAIPTLQRLALVGATPLIRKRARESMSPANP